MPLIRMTCAVSLSALLCVPATALSAVEGPAQAAKPGAAPEARTLPSTIPIFPLWDVVLFPGVSQPLIIFEPRYRAMMADVLKGDRIIGMTFLRPGYEANYEGRPPIHEIGCAGEITKFELLPDGRYTLVLRGLVKFRVLSEDQSRPYRLARVEAIPETPKSEELAPLSTMREQLAQLLVKATGSSPLPPELSDADFVNTVAQYLGIPDASRQELLERSGLLARAKALIDLLEMR